VIWGKVLHGRAEGAAACGNLAYLCDPALRDQVRARGDDLIELEIAAAGIATPFWEVKEHHREHPKGEWSATHDCGRPTNGPLF
jgi:hypothetical protein